LWVFVDVYHLGIVEEEDIVECAQRRTTTTVSQSIIVRVESNEREKMPS
jgi:hypothetical protein